MLAQTIIPLIFLNGQLVNVTPKKQKMMAVMYFNLYSVEHIFNEIAKVSTDISVEKV